MRRKLSIPPRLTHANVQTHTGRHSSIPVRSQERAAGLSIGLLPAVFLQRGAGQRHRGQQRHDGARNTAALASSGSWLLCLYFGSELGLGFGAGARTMTRFELIGFRGADYLFLFIYFAVSTDH